MRQNRPTPVQKPDDDGRLVEIPRAAVCINYGWKGRFHRDSGNVGPSIIKSFGSHDGGELRLWREAHGSRLVDVTGSSTTYYAGYQLPDDTTNYAG